jgi:hypothetical protein
MQLLDIEDGELQLPVSQSHHLQNYETKRPQTTVLQVKLDYGEIARHRTRLW